MKPQKALEVGKHRIKGSCCDRLHLRTCIYSKGHSFTSMIATVKEWVRAEGGIKQWKEK